MPLGTQGAAVRFFRDGDGPLVGPAAVGGRADSGSKGLREQFEADGLTGQSEGESLDALALVSQHPADVGTETFNRPRDLSILKQVEAELADVERAAQAPRRGLVRDLRGLRDTDRRRPPRSAARGSPLPGGPGGGRARGTPPPGLTHEPGERIWPGCGCSLRRVRRRAPPATGSTGRPSTRCWARRANGTRDDFAAVLGTAAVWVNGEPADRTTPVGERDEVAVLPPVSGGG